MSFDKKIEAAEKDVAEAKSNIAELVGIAEAEERDLTDAESILLDEYGENIERLTKRVADLTKAQKHLGMEVINNLGGPVERGAVTPVAPGVISRKSSSIEPVDLLWKEATCKLISHIERRPLLEVVKERYPHVQDLDMITRHRLDMQTRSAVSPAMTDVAGWASELTDDQMQGFQDLLRGTSTAAHALSNAGLTLSFNDATAIKVPKRAGSTVDLAPSWTGEGDAIPVKRGTFGQEIIYPYKWAVITTWSKEMSMRSNPEIEGLLRRFVVDDTGTQLDANFWSSAGAISGVRPDGILQGVTGTPSAGSDLDSINTDIRALIDPLIAGNLGSRIVIYMHDSIKLALSAILTPNGVYAYRDELNMNRLWGYEVVTSTNLPTDAYYAIDLGELASAQSSLDFTTSDSATLVEVNDDGVQPDMTADTHPRSPNTGQVGDAGGTTPPSPVRSLFQTESVALKMVNYISWHRMRDGIVSAITGVAY